MSRSRSTITAAPLVAVNVQGLQDLADKLKALGPESQAAFDDGLLEAGELVATEARRRSKYSSKIPGSIHVDVAGPGLVRVRTTLREAIAIENKGEGHVRHPLFGTRTHWYANPQPAFLHPALKAMRIDAREVVIKTVHEAARTVGLV